MVKERLDEMDSRLGNLDTNVKTVKEYLKDLKQLFFNSDKRGKALMEYLYHH